MRKDSTLKTFCLLAGLLLAGIVFTCSASAQLSGKGSIRGTVTDQTGAVVPNVNVVATHNGTNVQSIRGSSSAGDYDISPLDPGTYTVTVNATGFEGFKQEHVHVNALEVSNVDIKLTIGAASETVTVSEAPPSLETTNATLGATMEQELYAALPLEMGAYGSADQRRASDFVYLMPGVQGNETNGNATTNAGVINGSGSRGAVSAIYINGVPFTMASGEGDPRFVWTAISVDAVDQFQVETTGTPAMYEGQGVQNYTIKSGTNHFHGSVYDFIRNTAFDTWGFFAPAFVNPYTETTPGVASTGHATKPTEHENEYGIVLSGPIIRNKLFYFGNYNGFRFTQGPKPIFQTQPTALMRQGNFTELGVNIYDPRTTTCVGSSCTRLQFGPTDTMFPSATANVMPSGAISQVASNLQSFIPQNTNSSLTNNYLAGYKAGLTNWSTTHRLDFAIGSKNQLSLIAGQGRQASSVPTSQTTSGRNVGPIPINFGQAFAPKTTVIILQDAYTITPHIVNQFSYGFSRYNGPTINTDRGGAFGALANGYTGLPAGQAQDSFPTVNFGTKGVDIPTNLAGEPASVAIANSYALIDNVQWSKATHLVTIGGQIAWLQYQNTPDATGTSPLTITLSNIETASISGTTPSTSNGQAYASFLTGAPDSVAATQLFLATENGARFRPVSPYIQDTWRATKKLTIDAGLRWDYFPSYREKNDKLSWLNPTLTNPITGNLGAMQFAGTTAGSASCNCHSNINNYWGNWGPRLGVAYAVNEKTVLRASYGVMFTHGNGVGGAANSRTGTGTLGFSATNTIPWVTTASFAANPNLDAGFPSTPTFATNMTSTVSTGYYNSGTLATNVSSAAGGTGIGYGDTYLGGRAPEYVNWSVGFQREITSSVVLTAAYVGSEGHFLIEDTANGRGQYINQLNPMFLKAGNLLNAKATPANIAAALAAVGAGVTAPNPYTATTTSAGFDQGQSVPQALLPFPQYKTTTDTYGNYANSIYHGLQMSLNKRFVHGLTYMVNYTWSKSIDDGGTFRSGYDIPSSLVYNNNEGLTLNHFAMERSESTSSQRQHLVMTGVYALPFGTGRLGGGNDYTRKIFSGFKFSTIFQAYSGSPLALTAASCGINSSQGTCLPSLNPAYRGSGKINGHWGQGVTAANPSTEFLDNNAFVTTPSTYAAPLYSNASRTAPYGITGPGNYDLDISLRRVFALGFHGTSLTLDAELYNVTNHVQFALASGATVYTTPSVIAGVTQPTAFGTVGSQANNPRQMQFSGRISF